MAEYDDAMLARATLGLACSLVVLTSARVGAQDDDAAARDACGAAAFAAAEPDALAFQSLAIGTQIPAGLGPGELIRRLVGEIQASSQRAQTIIQEYEAVISCRSPRWTIAALERQAEVYDTLARAVATPPPALPQPLRSPVAATIEPQLAPIRCLAVVRRVRAVRAAQAALAPPTPQPSLVDRRAAEAAAAALTTLPQAEVARCVDDQSAHDASFPRFTLHDLAPFPLGDWAH